jgi:hypothetical protein
MHANIDLIQRLLSIVYCLAIAADLPKRRTIPCRSIAFVNVKSDGVHYEDRHSYATSVIW